MSRLGGLGACGPSPGGACSYDVHAAAAVGGAATASPSRDAGTPVHRAGGSTAARDGQELPPWKRVQRALQVDPLEYLHGLGRLSVTARPSSLQPLLKRRQHTLSSLCTPHLDLSGLTYFDLEADRAGDLVPPTGVAQCSLTLGTVSGVPSAGVKDRKCWLTVARLCLYDGARFHGNVQAVKPRAVKAGKEGDTWVFDAVPFTLRCPAALLPRASVYIEFNVSHELAPEEAARLPAKPERAARQVDEVAVAWALVELRGLLPAGGGSLGTTRSLNAPLRGGPLTQRLSLRRCLQQAAAAEQAAGMAAAPRKAPAYSGAEPCACIKLSPVPAPAAAAAALLPAAAIASPVAARVLGLYRLLLAEGLGCTEGAAACTAPVADPALAAFPSILDDPDLSAALFTLWEQQTAPRLAPTTGELKAALCQCVTLVWLMMGSQAIPPASIANHAVHQGERRQRMGEYLAQHPVAALNSDGHAWLHRPFDAAELVCDPLRALGLTV